MFLDSLNLKPETFGLDISDLSLKIIKLKKRRNRISLTSFGETDIQKGIIEGGEIKDEKGLAEIIKEAISKVKGEKLRTKYVVCSLPEEKSFLQVIQLPKMVNQELEGAVRFEAENYIPLPFEEVYLDFQKVQPLSDHLDHIDVLLAALPKKTIDLYVSSLRKAGLVPVALEVESQAISRAIVKGEISPFPVLLIDLGATRTGFIIFSGHSLSFTSSIPVSSQMFTEAIARSLNIDFFQAEILKRKHGLKTSQELHLKREPGSESFKKEVLEDRKIFDAMIPSVIDLVEQIKNRLNYYRTHASHEHIYAGNERSQGVVKKIILCGGGANLKELDNFFSSSLKIPVEIGNPWINILEEPLKEVPRLPYYESLKYTTAIGLALRGLINFSKY